MPANTEPNDHALAATARQYQGDVGGSRRALLQRGIALLQAE